MGIGTLRQYHSRPSNLTTIKDILGEAETKTNFVEAKAAAEKLVAEQEKLSEQLNINKEEFKKVVAESAEKLSAEGIVTKEIVSKETVTLENGKELRIVTTKGEPRKDRGINLNKDV